MLIDYDCALSDIPDWCRKCGHAFIGVEEDVNATNITLIRKMKIFEMKPIYLDQASATPVSNEVLDGIGEVGNPV